jgi:hypothetical protein
MVGAGREAEVISEVDTPVVEVAGAVAAEAEPIGRPTGAFAPIETTGTLVEALATDAACAALTGTATEAVAACGRAACSLCGDGSSFALDAD